jgi:hypothetical protein
MKESRRPGQQLAPARRGWVSPTGGTWPRRRRVGRRDRDDRSDSAARPMLFGIRGQMH